MVKLSRTSFAFFTLAGLPGFLFFATKGFGSCAAFFAEGVFFTAGEVLATGRVTVFFAAVVVALAAAGALLLTGFAAAGAAAWVAFDRGAGLADADLLLAAMVVLFARFADTVLMGGLVSMATASLLLRLNKINSICS